MLLPGTASVLTEKVFLLLKHRNASGAFHNKLFNTAMKVLHNRVQEDHFDTLHTSSTRLLASPASCLCLHDTPHPVSVFLSSIN